MAEGIKPLMRGAEEEAMKSNCWFVQVQDSGWCWAGGMSRTQAEAEKAMAACKAHNPRHTFRVVEGHNFCWQD